MMNGATAVSAAPNTECLVLQEDVPTPQKGLQWSLYLGRGVCGGSGVRQEASPVWLAA